MMVLRPIAPAVAEVELQLMLEDIYRVAGYDFREYAPGTLERRVAERVRAEGVKAFAGLQERASTRPTQAKWRSTKPKPDGSRVALSRNRRDRRFFDLRRERRRVGEPRSNNSTPSSRYTPHQRCYEKVM
jgi:hypothetical protein